MNEESKTVVYRPCPGAPEIQEIQDRLRSLSESLDQALEEKLEGVYERAEGYEDWEDWEAEDDWRRLVCENSAEAKEATKSHELSVLAMGACYDALAPINAPYVKAQEDRARADGAFPDFEEACGAMQEQRTAGGTQIIEFDATFSSKGEAKIPAGTYDVAGCRFNALPRPAIASPATSKPANSDHPFKGIADRKRKRR